MPSCLASVTLRHGMHRCSPSHPLPPLIVARITCIKLCSHIAGLTTLYGVDPIPAAGQCILAGGRIVARVPGNQILWVALPIPAYISCVFHENSHVPFTYLMDDALCQALEGCQDGNKGMQLCGSILVTSSKELLCAGKEDISYQQWCQAFNRFMLLVEQHCPMDCPGWTTHYHFLVGHKSFKGDKFNLYLMYNTAIHFALILNKEFNLATVQDTVLAYTMLSFQANTALAEMQLLFASSAQVTSTSGPVQSGSGQAIPTAAPANTALAKHHSSTSVDLDKLCLRCGCRNTHQTRLCVESSSFNSGTILLQGTQFTQSLRDAWSNSKGKQFCYNSNTSRGCTCSRCTYVHTCMLCGVPGHLSINCSRSQPASG
jgi:hypothetical protein